MLHDRNGFHLYGFDGKIFFVESVKQRDNSFTYLILGSGRQGTAAAYDLACYGNAQQIIFVDRDIAISQAAAQRINHLSGRDVASGRAADVSDSKSLQLLMNAADAALSAVPYYYNAALTQLAIETGTHFCDMGGHTDTVRSQLALSEQARLAKVSVVPDCGMGPGLINNMAAYALTLMDETSEIVIYDAGLPQEMQPPWYYQSTFNLNGLTNEMDGKSVVLRNGKIAWVDTLSEPEEVEIPGVGILQADLISGGASTAPWSFQGRLQRYENKTLRHAQHWEWMRAYKALGLFREEAYDLHGTPIVPRDFFHALLGEKINAQQVKDMAIIRVKAVGKRDRKPTAMYIDLLDYYDEQTGFTAMERLTGWHCAIIMGFQTAGLIEAGAKPVELAISAGEVMQAFHKRGIHHKITYEDIL